jgi:hypothetical protein
MSDPKTASPNDWQPCSVALSFRLGEIGIFSKPLHGYAFRRHFTDMAVKEMPWDPVAAGAPASRFYFLPCYPIERESPVIERRGRWVFYTPYVFENHYVDLMAIGSFDAYMAGVSSKTRSTLMRKVRKFQEASGGSLNWKVYDRPAQLDEFFRIAGPLSAATYQARLLDSGLPTHPAFVDEAKKAAEDGGAIGYLLFLAESAVAYVFCFRRNGIVTYDYVGFDPEKADLSPGTVLQYLIMQHLFAEGRSRIFDFTEGEGGHKKLFGRSSMRCAKSYVLPDSFRSRWLFKAHAGLNRSVECVGDWLGRLGLKDKVRSLIRRSA